MLRNQSPIDVVGNPNRQSGRREMDLSQCWEFHKCGRETECPAYPNQGRNCFAVTATLCRGEQQGSYEQKIVRCRTQCQFYKEVMFSE
jgi:hypothetical protein